MPELDPAAVSSLLPQSPLQSPTPPASPAITLPPLASPADPKFLNLLDFEAGRAVIIELYATPGMSGDQRRSLWQDHQARGVNMTQLGVAAKALERAGWNWRQAKSPAMVHRATKLLPQGATN